MRDMMREVSYQARPLFMRRRRCFFLLCGACARRPLTHTPHDNNYTHGICSGSNSNDGGGGRMTCRVSISHHAGLAYPVWVPPAHPMTSRQHGENLHPSHIHVNSTTLSRAAKSCHHKLNCSVLVNIGVQPLIGISGSKLLSGSRGISCYREIGD